MSAKTITCRDCGLVVCVLRDLTGSKLLYDINDWHRLCKHLDRGDPALCLIWCNETSSPNEGPTQN
jgi:hypothetical protein